MYINPLNTGIFTNLNWFFRRISGCQKFQVRQTGLCWGQPSSQRPLLVRYLEGETVVGAVGAHGHDSGRGTEAAKVGGLARGGAMVVGEFGNFKRIENTNQLKQSTKMLGKKAARGGESWKFNYFLLNGSVFKFILFWPKILWKYSFHEINIWNPNISLISMVDM